MLRTYNSKPCSVLACVIEDTGTVTKVKGKESTYEYTNKGKGASRDRMIFTATSEIEDGDFIIQQSKTNIYHCPAAVFVNKYNVQGMLIQ